MSKMNLVERAAVKTVFSRRLSAEAARSMILGLYIPKNPAILEIGCGPGAALFKAIEILDPSSAIGIDIDDKLLAFARMQVVRKRLPYVKLIKARAESLPLAPASVNLVIGFEVLHHFEDWKLALQEVARVLKPGGHYLSRDFFAPAKRPVVGRVIHRIPRDLRWPIFLEHCKEVGLSATDGHYASMHGESIFIKE